MNKTPLVAFAFLASPLFAATPSPDCATVLDASMRQLTTPSRAHVTDRTSAKTRTNETIYTGDAVYLQVDGAWKKSRLSPAAMADMKRNNVANATTLECRHVRDETVAGEPAAVYATKTTVDDVASDGTIWISARTKLPLRIEAISDAGTPDEHVATTVYEYGDVKAPIP
jgi:hypothetical protein